MSMFPGTYKEKWWKLIKTGYLAPEKVFWCFTDFQTGQAIKTNIIAFTPKRLKVPKRLHFELTQKDIRPGRNIFSPVSGWKAESCSYLAFQSCSFVNPKSSPKFLFEEVKDKVRPTLLVTSYNTLRVLQLRVCEKRVSRICEFAKMKHSARISFLVELCIFEIYPVRGIGSFAHSKSNTIQGWFILNNFNLY